MRNLARMIICWQQDQKCHSLHTWAMYQSGCSLHAGPNWTHRSPARCFTLGSNSKSFQRAACLALPSACKGHWASQVYFAREAGSYFTVTHQMYEHIPKYRYQKHSLSRVKKHQSILPYTARGDESKLRSGSCHTSNARSYFAKKNTKPNHAAHTPKKPNKPQVWVTCKDPHVSS